MFPVPSLFVSKRGGIVLLLQVLALFLPLALLVSGAAYYVFSGVRQDEIAHHGMRQSAAVELGKGSLTRTLQILEQDLMFFVSHHSLRDFLDRPTPEALRDVELNGLNFSASSQRYDQIRWLDESGKERLRIDYKNGAPAAVAPEALQDKSDRYYFSAAMRLGRGEIYLSPLDLNVEQGRIEIPYKPMLRIAAPLFDAQGKRRGAVVLNYRGALLLDRFDKATAALDRGVMLLNADGYWLKSLQPDEAWGFMLGRGDLTFARRHAAAWQRVAAEDQGQFLDAEGLWTFQTFYPLREVTSAAELDKTGARAYVWKIVAYTPRKVLYASSSRLIVPLLAGIILLLVLLLAGSVKLVLTRRARNEARAKLSNINRDLERLIEERTAQLRAKIAEQQRAEARMRVQSAALEAAANAIVITDTEAVIEWANPAFCALTGYALQEAIGKRPKDLVRSGLQSQAFYQVMWETIKSGQVWRGEVINKRKDGTLYHEELTITPVLNEGGAAGHFIAIKENISHRKRLETRQLAQFQLLEKTSGDAPLTALLEEMIRFIETQAPELRCSILLADEKNQVLRHGAAPSLPDAYNQLVEGLPIAEGCGSCGTAAARRETVVVSDVRSDPLWADYMPLLHGFDWLRACWSTPFFDSKGRLLGTFGVYAAEPRTPSAAEAELIAYAVPLAGLVVERKQANESLRQSEKKLAAILDSVEAFIYIKDTVLHYQYANRHVCELFGKSLEEVTGKGDEAFFDAGTAANLRDNDRRVLERGERIETEEVNTGKDSGQTRTYLSVKLPLKDEKGGIYALCGISTDITKLKQAEAALRESEERLKRAARAGNVGLWEWDLRTNQVFFSAEWKSQIGYQEHEIRSHYAEWESRLHPDDREPTLSKLRAYIDQLAPDYHVEFRFRHKNGSYRWILAQGSLLCDAEGRPARIFGSHIDITERKRAETLLKESEQKLRCIFEQARDGIVLIDCDSGLIVNCNPEFEAQSGRMLEQLRCMHIWDLRPTDKRQRAEQLYRGVMATGEGEAADLELQRPDGTIVPVEFRATTVTIGGKRYIQSITRDITERKQAEAALRESGEKLRLFIEHAPAALAMFDCGMRYLAVSRRWITDYGLGDAREIVGRSHYEIFPEIPERWKTIHRRGLAGEVVSAEDDRFERFDGSVQWLRWEVRPWYAASGGVGGIVIFTEDVTERKLAKDALRESEQRFRALFEQAAVGVAQIETATGRFVRVNQKYCEIAGLQADEMTSATFMSITHPEDLQGDLDNMRRLVAGEIRQFAMEKRYLRPGGAIIWVNLTVSPMWEPFSTPDYHIAVIEDITERKQAEARILNLNRVYTVLSNINEAIVRLRDMDTLFREVCRIAVEHGGFRMAWIGFPDLARGELSPVASAGMVRGYLDDIHISLAGGERGHGPTGTAFHEGRTVCCNDIEHDPRMAPWRERALALGFRASIAMPIKVKDVVRGVYNIYAGQVDFFTGDEIRLLEELSADIGFALETAETDAERRRAEERLRQAAAVFESTREGVMVTDSARYIVMVNQAFTDITGYAEAEILGKKPVVLSSGRHDHDFYTALWACVKASGHWQGEIWNRRKNGEVYPELLSISTVNDETGHISGYVGVFADISKLKASEAKLEFLAHHDPLTRLPNRLLLLSRLDHAIKMARREDRQLALLMLDLDRFKDVNDSFGHLAGDELLQQVSERLTAHLRSVDTVSRLGGDEFTVLLEDIAHPEDAARVAESVIAALSEPWSLSMGSEVRIGTSIGISLYPQHGNTAVELLQQADAALYQAKMEGRGRFKYFSENLTSAARERLLLETRLRQAIGQNELRVFYQPQVHIASGRIVGAEALVRWQDPEHGLIPPGRFIPVAEATGLIGAIGEWVLKETCLQGKRWLEAGYPPLILAVNVSPHQFLNSDIAAVVTNVLDESGFPAAQLELELTESALMAREKETVETLNRLRSIGVRLAIDDFGTGYSSLAYLKRFPLDLLKIDKSFIDDIPDSQDDMQIAATIVAIAHTLRLQVLAEGVETAAQLAFLKERGCDFYQGYLKSPPVPADVLEQLILTNGGARGRR